MGGPKVSVGYPFFNRTFVPLMVPLLLAVAVGPLLAWKRGDLLGALQRMWVALAAVIVVALVAFYLAYGGPVLSVFGFALAAWVGAGALVEWAERVRLFRASSGESLRRAIHLPRASYGMTIAHIGVAIAVTGFAAIGLRAGEHPDDAPGRHASRSPASPSNSPAWIASRARTSPPTAAASSLHRGDRIVAEMHPERRFFPLQQETTAKTAIHTNLLRDFYLALGDPDGKGGWAVRAYWKPLVPWIWIGAVIMAFGGLVSLSDRRWRVGAAARARREDAVPAAAE